MKTIAHLIIALDNGGCENQLLRILPKVTNFRHVVITLHHEGILAPQFKKAGIEVVNIGWQGFTDLAGYRTLVKTLKQLRPSLVMTYLAHADLLGKTIIQLLTPYRPIPSLRTTHNHPLYRMARVAEWLTRPFTRHYVANSEAIKEYYSSHLGVATNKITVIPNGIDQEAIAKATASKTLRSELGVAEDSHIITCVANLHPYKGHTYLLEAFETVYQEISNCDLLLVGEGQEHENLIAQIEHYGSKEHIHFLGRRTDVPEILSITDIFAFPTLFEGMSNALMEAMAAGKAIIATDIPENVHLLGRKSAIFIPVKQSHPLASAIVDLLSNTKKRESLGKRAQEKVKTTYDLSVIAKQLTEFYQKWVS